MMYISLYALLSLASLLPSVAATLHCAEACESALSYIKFSGNATKIQCSNSLHIASYYACLRRYCPTEAEAKYATLKTGCKTVSTLPNVTSVTMALDSLREVGFEDLYKKISLNQTVLLAEPLYALSIRTIVSDSLHPYSTFI